MMKNKCIAFVDLMGFTEYIEVYHSTSIADLLENVETISAIMEHSEAFNRNKKSVFEDFLPASDSICITADKKNANSFIEQLSLFIIQCFDINGRRKMYRSKKNPTKGVKVETTYRTDGITRKYIEIDFLPIVFRGGISFGEITLDSVTTINGGKISKDGKNAWGKGLLKAILLERNGHGPKLFIDDAFYELLDERHRVFVAKEHSGEKHYLWAVHLSENIVDNNIEVAINPYNTFLESITNLYHNWAKGGKGEATYFEFIKMTLLSIQRVFSIHYKEEEINGWLREFICKNDLELTIF
jgi:hypothetical protein